MLIYKRNKEGCVMTMVKPFTITAVVLLQLGLVSTENCLDTIGSCGLTDWYPWNCTGCFANEQLAYRQRGICCMADTETCLIGCRISRSRIEEYGTCLDHCVTRTTSLPTSLPTISSTVVDISTVELTSSVTTNVGSSLRTANSATSDAPDIVSASTNAVPISSTDSPMASFTMSSSDTNPGVTTRNVASYTTVDRRTKSVECKILWVSLFILGLIVGAFLMAIILKCTKRRNTKKTIKSSNYTRSGTNKTSNNAITHGRPLNVGQKTDEVRQRHLTETGYLKPSPSRAGLIDHGARHLNAMRRLKSSSSRADLIDHGARHLNAMGRLKSSSSRAELDDDGAEHLNETGYLNRSPSRVKLIDRGPSNSLVSSARYSSTGDNYSNTAQIDSSRKRTAMRFDKSHGPVTDTNNDQDEMYVDNRPGAPVLTTSSSRSKLLDTGLEMTLPLSARLQRNIMFTPVSRTESTRTINGVQQGETNASPVLALRSSGLALRHEEFPNDMPNVRASFIECASPESRTSSVVTRNDVFLFE